MKKNLILTLLVLLASIAGYSQAKKGLPPLAPDRVAYLKAKNAAEPRPRFWITGMHINEYGNDNCREDKGFKTDLQKNSVDKVLFSKASTTDEATAGQFTNAFTSDDNIYMRMFLNTCMINHICYSENKSDTKMYFNEIGNYFVMIYFDDTQLALAEQTLYGDKVANTTAEIGMKTPEGENRINRDFYSVLNNAGPGKHTVKVEVWPYTNFRQSSEKPAAVGEFVWENLKE